MAAANRTSSAELALERMQAEANAGICADACAYGPELIRYDSVNSHAHTHSCAVRIPRKALTVKRCHDMQTGCPQTGAQ